MTRKQQRQNEPVIYLLTADGEYADPYQEDDFLCLPLTSDRIHYLLERMDTAALLTKEINISYIADEDVMTGRMAATWNTAEYLRPDIYNYNNLNLEGAEDSLFELLDNVVATTDTWLVGQPEILSIRASVVAPSDIHYLNWEFRADYTVMDIHLGDIAVRTTFDRSTLMEALQRLQEGH